MEVRRMDIDTIYREEVFSIPTTASIAEAARQMRANEVSSLMVLDGDTCVGIITERDLTRAIVRGDPLETARVSEFMTDRPIFVTPSTGVREAAAEMFETDVRHLPVEVKGKLVGMVSLRDLLNVVVEDENL
jgi:signal-transduction protein with cAMP-binding, CBS, and nucleotidyltransferase domain